MYTEKPSWVAYVDFRSAVDRQSLWLLLRFKGIPEKILQLLEDLYSNTFSCVRVNGELSPWFESSSGVRQGCVVAPELFLEPMDWITNRAAHKGFLGVTVGEEICTGLDYADDVSLLASMLEILVLALEILHEESSQIGLETTGVKQNYNFLTTLQLLLPRYLYSIMTLRLSIPLSTLNPA